MIFRTSADQIKARDSYSNFETEDEKIIRINEKIRGEGSLKKI